MKKSRQIVLGLMLIFVMALASGCGDGRNNTKSTESTRQSQSAISAESTEGGMQTDRQTVPMREKAQECLTDLPTTLKTVQRT